MAVLSVMVAKTTLATEMSQCFALLAGVIRGGDGSLPHTELEQKFIIMSPVLAQCFAKSRFIQKLLKLKWNSRALIAYL